MKVVFVVGDVRHWEPAELFDVAFTLDSLMLVNSVDEILVNVHAALKPGGVVVLTEMTSGPNVTDELLNLIWRIDGMITVPPPDDYHGMLIAAGFSDIEITDVTFLAEDCFRLMTATVQRSDRCARVSAMASDSTACSGRSTMGVKVPS